MCRGASRCASRRVSVHPSAMKSALAAASVLDPRLLKLLGPLLIALVLLLVYVASSRYVVKQEVQIKKSRYGAYSFDVVNEYDHDPHAFTQGLVYGGNDTLYESTGMYGRSSVRKVHIHSGQILQMHHMEHTFFGEGLTLLNRRLFQVAWRITSGFMYDMDTLSPLGSFRHPMKDGWGLATDGKVLYGSDGTSTIYVLQPSTFKEEKRFVVKDQNKEIRNLNELEYVDGELWANVWLTDCIARISPLDGHVLGWIFLHELKNRLPANGNQANGNQAVDVLNGIAWDPEENRLFVTGKYWPKLYQIKVKPLSEGFRDHKHVWEKCHLSF